MRRLVIAAICGAVCATAAWAEQTPEVVVTATPLRGTESNAAATAADFARVASPSVLDALQLRIPGAALSDVQGSPFSQTFEFRGFEASPVSGAPQGLAVYLGGVRLNEAFGDSVNWDLIPEVAVERADLVTSSPTFGLNAIGGAVALTGKTGETWTGRELTVRAGSFGRGEGALQLGGKRGAFDYYIAAEGAREDGWRQRSGSSVARLYGDLGWSRDRLAIRLTTAAASSDIGAVGPTPVDLLATDRTSVFTSPQKTRNSDALATLNLNYRGGGGWDLTGEVHVRRFVQHRVDGNDGDFEGCSRSRTNPLFNTLCMQDDAFPAAIRPPAAAFQVLDQSGAPIPCPPLVPGQTRPCNGVAYGTLDRSRASGHTVGLSAQFSRGGVLFGRRSAFVIGAALDYSRFAFASDSELGVIEPDLSVETVGSIPGVGFAIHTAGLIGYAPVSLSGRRTDVGLYVADTFELTRRLTLTASARLNSIRISAQDLAADSPELNGAHRFTRVDPQIGWNYRLVRGVSLFASYAEANRSPTPLELACSDPQKPCLLENALVSDPPLKQVVAHTVEAGLKGDQRALGGRFSYSLALFNTDLDDDILPLASAIQGRGYYTNVPGTRRRGGDAMLRFEHPRWSAYAGYSHVDATYRFSGVLASPNSPTADSNGNIAIRSGDRIGGTPADRFKFGGELRAAGSVTLGADVIAVGPQRFVGDENGSNARLRGYRRLDLRGEWRLSRKFALQAQLLNALGERYATYGTYFNADGVVDAGSGLPASADPRTLTPAPPRAFRIGVTARW